MSAMAVAEPVDVGARFMSPARALRRSDFFVLGASTSVWVFVTCHASTDGELRDSTQLLLNYYCIASLSGELHAAVRLSHLHVSDRHGAPVLSSGDPSKLIAVASSVAASNAQHKEHATLLAQAEAALSAGMVAARGCGLSGPECDRVARAEFEALRCPTPAL